MTEKTNDSLKSSQTSLQPSSRPRVLSGMRPTGRLHLGNYMGALYNWVQLQRQYDCYFFIADLHALTTDYADPTTLRQSIRDVALDFLSAGLDPEQSTIFIQSHVPQHAELFTLFSMFTPLPWLERVPTYKDQQEQLREKDLNTYGFLGYPLLQAADILLYQPDFVPVGQDQVAHVELTREVARRFNALYCSQPTPAIEKAREDHSDREILAAELSANTVVDGILPEPKVLLTPSPKLPGLDGRKMSKSYGNTIMLSEPETDLRAKLKTMVTDPARIRRTDPGNPDICPVFDLHKVFSTEETRAAVREGCTTAGIGCIECKGWVADAIVREIAPIQERRRALEADPGQVDAILWDGSARARQRAIQTLQHVRQAIGLE
ncbi:tryptophan--tRNA ligase [Tunturiibacter empetritectus]|uniref:tryptophan--tRNA ligase n=1 Tax=Tunturiibacter empetritectus TaxID=3069691 RepID=UPI003DA727FC